MTHRKATNVEEDERKPLSNKGTVPYPYVQFRLVNDRCNSKGSEILGCKVVCYVLKIKALSGVSSKVDLSAKSADDGSAQDNYDNCKITYELPIEPEEDPYMTHVMSFRSYLDEHSPLLNRSTRDQINELGGWPADINDHSSIRACLSKSVFQIALSFEATSNLTAQPVFRVDVFKMEDIYIGWRMANVLRLTAESKGTGGVHAASGAHVDHTRVHMIAPQKGGGEEPIGERNVERNILKFMGGSAESTANVRVPEGIIDID
jgi:hypothetical protein